MAEQNDKQFNIYPLKLWIISIGIVAPIILGLFTTINNFSNLGKNNSIGVIFIFILFGLLFSIPTFLVSIILFKILFEKSISTIVIKVLINLIGISGVIITFRIMEFNDYGNTYALIYSFSIIVSSFFVSIKHRNKF